jgi:peptide/nickel transport system ATP-binding protein
MPLLEVQDLKTYYFVGSAEVKAVDGVSFTLDAGESIGIAGESGCGKSTLALSLMRLIKEREGQIRGGIRMDGQDLLAMPMSEFRGVRWKKISYVSQSAMGALNPVQNVGSQIVEAIRTHENISKNAALERTVELFKQVKVDPSRVKSYPHELSGGMRQRVMIAMGLACSPPIVICDEITTALDVVTQVQILRLLKSLQDTLDMSTIVISHELPLLGQVCDRIIIMYAGKVVETAATAEIFREPKHPYTRFLLDSLMDVRLPRRIPEGIEGSPPDLIDPPIGCRFWLRCPYAESVCEETEPPLVEVEPKRYVACHLLEQIKAGTAGKAKKPSLIEVAPSQPVEVVEDSSKLISETQVKIDNVYKYFAVRMRKGVFGKKRYVHAVDGVSFDINKGETFGLVGETGCGKTTIGRLLLGLEKPDRGQIFFQGIDISGFGSRQMKALRREAQMIFQDPFSSLNPMKDIYWCIAEPLKVHGIYSSQSEVRDKVSEMLETVGLPQEFHSKLPDELSGGEKQRVGVARALSIGANFIVCDEPVSMLDASIKAGVVSLLMKLKRQMNLTYIFVTHELGAAYAICDRLAVMYTGRMVELASTEKIIKEPLHPYTKLLIDANPPLIPDESWGSTIPAGEVPFFIEPPLGCRYHPRCPKAQDRCKEEDPSLVEAAPGHYVACNLL